jgi:hypothetical protein
MASGPEGALRPWESGLLRDLLAAGVMTTSQVHRLRFPRATVAHCRIRLNELCRRGWVRRIHPGSGPTRECCWCVTERGAAAVAGHGARPPVAVVDGRGRDQLGALLERSEQYIERRIAAILEP